MAYYRTSADWIKFLDFVRSDLDGYQREYGFMYKHGSGEVDVIVASENESVLEIIASKYPLEFIEDHPAAFLERNYGFVNAEFFDVNKLF